MGGHADMRVITSRLGGGEQDQVRLPSGRLVGPADQLLADSPPLIRFVNREVGEVRCKNGSR